MKRLGSFVLGVSLFYVGCSGSQGSSMSAVVENPTPQGVSYYYFTCASDQFQIGSSTQLICEDAQCVSMSRSVTIAQSALATTCRVIKTPAKDIVTPDSETLGTFAYRSGSGPEENILRAPDTAMLSSTGDIQVFYPQAGNYVFRLTRDRDAVSLRPAGP